MAATLQQSFNDPFLLQKTFNVGTRIRSNLLINHPREDLTLNNDNKTILKISSPAKNRISRWMINLGQFKHRNSVIDTNMMLLQKSQHLIWPFGGPTLQIFRDRTRQHSRSSRLELKWTVRECVLQTKNWPINNNASYLVFGNLSMILADCTQSPPFPWSHDQRGYVGLKMCCCQLLFLQIGLTKKHRTNAYLWHP